MSSEDSEADSGYGKALVASKQFWLMILTMLLAIIESPAVNAAIPWTVTYGVLIVAVLSIIIRKVTDEPIVGIVKTE